MRVFTPVELVANLEERFRMLIGGRRSRMERHQTMRGTLDWSYDLCTTVEQAVFDRLSVFPAGFDLAAARAVAAGDGVDDFDVVDVVPSWWTARCCNAPRPPTAPPGSGCWKPSAPTDANTCNIASSPTRYVNAMPSTSRQRSPRSRCASTVPTKPRSAAATPSTSPTPVLPWTGSSIARTGRTGDAF